MSCPPPKAAPLSSTSPSPTQRSLTVAVVVTLVCLPLLLLDLLWSGGSSARPVAAVSAEVTEAPAVEPDTAPDPAASSSAVDPAASTPVPTTAPAVAAASAPAVRAAAPVVTTPPVRWSPPPTTAAPAPPPPPPAPVVSGSDAEFLACVRARESGGNYSIVDGSGQYMGAYQYSQSTWDGIAARSGRSDLVGVRPNTVSPADQDAIAIATLAISGRSPWGGICS